MGDDKKIYELEPIEVLPGRDADVVGSHYRNLHQQFNDRAGQGVEATYTKKDFLMVKLK